MANDVSYFKVNGEETTYSFNDADLEAALDAEIARAKAAEEKEATRAQGVEGDLDDLTTTAKDSLVAAVNEVAGELDNLDSDLDGLSGSTPHVITATVIPSTDDLNNYKTNGIWRTGGTVPVNCPAGFTWSQLTVTIVGTTYRQELVNGDSVAVRMGNTSSWYAWTLRPTRAETDKKANSGLVSWGTSISFTLLSGHAALLLVGSRTLYGLWMSGSGIGYTALANEDSGLTIAATGTTVTVTASSNRAFNVFYT